MSEPYRMSAEEADLLDEVAQMRVEDPEGYADMMADLRGDTPSEADIASRHGQAILDQISAARNADPIGDLFRQAWKEAAAKDGEQ